MNSPKQRNGEPTKKVTPLHRPAVGRMRELPKVYDIPFAEGDLIPCGPDDPAYVVRKGVIRVETDVLTPTGYRTMSLGTIEFGEHFNMSKLFGREEGGPPVRYKAVSQVIVIEFMPDMLPQNVEAYTGLFEAYVRTNDRLMARLRQLVVRNAEEMYRINEQKADAAAIASELATTRMELNILQNRSAEQRATIRNLVQANKEAREGFDQELQHMTAESLEPYTELERLKAAEANRWKAIESLTARFSIKVEDLSDFEAQALLGLEDEWRKLSPPSSATPVEERIDDAPEITISGEDIAELDAPDVQDEVDDLLESSQLQNPSSQRPYRARMPTLDLGDPKIDLAGMPFDANEPATLRHGTPASVSEDDAPESDGDRITMINFLEPPPGQKY